MGRLEYRRDVQSPVLKLKRGEDRRLRAGHLWIFCNEVDTAATPLTQFEPGALCRCIPTATSSSDYAYVNPHTLIARASSAATPPIHSMHRCWCTACTSRSRCASAVSRAVLPPGLRRIRWPAGTGARPLRRRRRRRRAPRRAWRAARPKSKRRCARWSAPAAMVWKNDAGARELEGLAQYVGVRANGE